MDKKDYIALLKDHGIRPTANRILVVEAMDRAVRPLSLAEVEDRLLSLDKSTIYRCLMLFKDTHLVHAIEDGSDSVRYELCHSHSEHDDDDLHVHFHCERCNRTFCLYDTPIPKVELPDGFVLFSVNYMVKGICDECQSNLRREKQKGAQR